MPDDRPKRKGLLDEMDELEQRRKEKKRRKGEKSKKDDDAGGLDLGRIK